MSSPQAQRRWLPLQSDATSESSFHFVVMTYNVLAQCLIQREMYLYASKQALRWAFRCKNILYVDNSILQFKLILTIDLYRFF
jgi:mRNA deadenylase 3'-5' endonuclease subunit Ccr4